jgi:hypothetical protein
MLYPCKKSLYRQRMRYNTEGRRGRTRPYFWVAIAFLVVGIFRFAAHLWFDPFGTGEYRTSLDGRFKASASNLNQNTLFNGRVQYIELLVTEPAAKREVWRVQFHHDASGKVPHYGDRSEKPFIEWAQDSRSVTIPVGVEQQVKLPMPKA